MAYTVHQAKTHFSRLLKEAEAGQEVIVMRGKKPVAKLVPPSNRPAEYQRVPGRLMGLSRVMHWDEDAFDPMTDKDWWNVAEGGCWMRLWFHRPAEVYRSMTYLLDTHTFSGLCNGSSRRSLPASVHDI
jgi:prevent-host-death family protein